MKTYIHARLSLEEQKMLQSLKKLTGHTESELVRRGLELVVKELGRRPSALAVAGRSAGKFRKGPRDLSTNKDYMDGFGR